MSQQEVMAELQAKIGTETHVGDWVMVDQSRINQFADATGDHQWIHVDADRAKSESPFKDTIAHGFLTLSMVPMLTREVEGDGPRYPGVKLAVNYGLNKVRFPSPVKVGSRVRSRTRLKEVGEVTGGLQIIREITVELEGGDKPCCVAETITRLYFS